MAKIQNEKAKLRVLFNQLQVQRSPGYYSLTGQPMHFHTKWAARKLARLGLGSYDYDSSYSYTYATVNLPTRSSTTITPNTATFRRTSFLALLFSSSKSEGCKSGSNAIRCIFSRSYQCAPDGYSTHTNFFVFGTNYSFLEKNVMSSFRLAYLDLGFIAEEVPSENKF